MKVYIRFLKEVPGICISKCIILPINTFFQARIYPRSFGDGLVISVKFDKHNVEYITDTPDGIVIGEDFEITSSFDNFYEQIYFEYS